MAIEINKIDEPQDIQWSDGSLRRLVLAEVVGPFSIHAKLKGDFRSGTLRLTHILTGRSCGHSSSRGRLRKLAAELIERWPHPSWARYEGFELEALEFLKRQWELDEEK